jgi:ABC-type transport system involved in multi-copper enzyme maturation permease subunit
MIATLKAEFRKLLSVRTTYVVTGILIVFVIFVAFFLEGWRLNPSDLMQSNQLAGDVTGALNMTVFGAIIAILLMTHEYRYNTIMYTLTSSNSRMKVLLSKFAVITAYSLFLAALIAVLSPLMAYLGVHAHGHVLVHQTIDVGSLAWRSLFVGWGYGMMGLILAFITRNQVASIVILLLTPTLVENLIGFLLLKHNSVYMPFSALSQVINGPSHGTPVSSTMTPGKAAEVYMIYLIVGWIVSVLLFTKRDAT